ncbi:protein phosphatase, partial [Clostridium perfringens]|nr:protein phosphatase [Clostridium perfringens]
MKNTGGIIMKIFKRFFLILLVIISCIVTNFPTNTKACTLLNSNFLMNSEFSLTLSNENNIPYIKNSVIPKSLYVIMENQMTNAEKTMIATLQGLISNKTDTQIYILPSSESDYKIWLESLKKEYKIKEIKIEDPWELLNI